MAGCSFERAYHPALDRGYQRSDVGSTRSQATLLSGGGTFEFGLVVPDAELLYVVDGRRSALDS
jgi:hypothetical protein